MPVEVPRRVRSSELRFFEAQETTENQPDCALNTNQAVKSKRMTNDTFEKKPEQQAPFTISPPALVSLSPPAVQVSSSATPPFKPDSHTQPMAVKTAAAAVSTAAKTQLETMDTFQGELPESESTDDDGLGEDACQEAYDGYDDGDVTSDDGPDFQTVEHKIAGVTTKPRSRNRKGGPRPPHDRCGGKNVIWKGAGRCWCLDCKKLHEKFPGRNISYSFRPNGRGRHELSSQEFRDILHELLLGGKSLKRLAKSMGWPKSTLDDALTSRLDDEIPELLSQVDVSGIKAMGVDSTEVIVKGSPYRAAFAGDAIELRSTHTKLVKSESYRFMRAFLKAIIRRGCKPRLWIADLSDPNTRAIQSVAKGTTFLIQGCLKHFMDNLEENVPTGPRTWAKSKKARTKWEKWKRWLGEEESELSDKRMRLRQKFKRLAIIAAFSVTNAARERNKKRLAMFNPKGDAAIENEKRLLLGRLCDGNCQGYQPGKYYHTVEEIARHLEMPLTDACRLQFNNMAESHQKAFKRVQTNFGGSFKSERTARGYLRATYYFLEKEREEEGPPTRRKATLSIPIARLGNPVNLEKLAADVGADKELLAEAARAKGMAVFEDFAVPFNRRLREKLEKVVVRILSYHSKDKAALLADLPAAIEQDGKWHNHHLSGPWSRYPEGLQALMLTKLGFEVYGNEAVLTVKLPSKKMKAAAVKTSKALPIERKQGLSIAPENLVKEPKATESPAADLLKSQSVVRVIREILADNTTTAGIARSLRITDAAVSLTLKRLKAAGLAEASRQEGRFKHYDVNVDAIAKILVSRHDDFAEVARLLHLQNRGDTAVKG